MDIRVLGPVEVCEGGAQIPIEGAQQQCVLGLLAAYKGSYVPVDRLIEALWEDDPPKTAKTIVQLKVVTCGALWQGSSGALCPPCGCARGGCVGAPDQRSSI